MSKNRNDSKLLNESYLSGSLNRLSLPQLNEDGCCLGIGNCHKLIKPTARNFDQLDRGAAQPLHVLKVSDRARTGNSSSHTTPSAWSLTKNKVSRMALGHERLHVLMEDSCGTQELIHPKKVNRRFHSPRNLATILCNSTRFRRISERSVLASGLRWAKETRLLFFVDPNILPGTIPTNRSFQRFGRVLSD